MSAISYLRRRQNALKAELLEVEKAISDLTSGPVQPSTPLKECGLSSRTFLALQNDCINLVSDVLARTEGELLRTPNFGRKQLNELTAFLAANSLSLAPSLDQRHG